MAATDLTLTGAIQKYLTAESMDLRELEFRTPLVNSPFMNKVTIPKNGGQYGEFRKFAHLAPATNGTDDGPKVYDHDGEPATGRALTGDVFQVPLEVMKDVVTINKIASLTDPTDLIEKAKTEINILVKRMIHQLTNDRLVRVTSNSVLHGVSGAPSLTAAAVFKCIYAGGVANFAGLTKNNVYSMMEFRRARAYLSNSNVLPANGELYVAVISNAVKEQLMEDDDFKDLVKRHEQMAQKTFTYGNLGAWQGMDWHVQDDSYRCNLASAGGALTTRANTGSVFVSHVLGADAAANIQVGGALGIKPTFKTQDISLTGTQTTIGFTILASAFCQDATYGLNIAGCSNFDQGIADLP